MGDIKFTKDKQAVQMSSELKAKTKQLKKIISQKASMANKRLVRLEKKGLTDTPSYRNWVEYGGGAKFSVKGKDYNELQAELARVNSFVDNATSTIRGTNRVLKSMAETTGITYKNVGELYTKAGLFFELASKVEQYLNSAMQGASALGYQKIWQAINTYVSKNKVDLSRSETDIESIIDEIGELAMNEYSDFALDSLFDTFSQLNYE